MHDEACAMPRRWRIARRPDPGRRSWKQVLDRLEQAFGHLLRSARCVDQLDALRLLGGDDVEGGVDLAMIFVRAASDSVARPAVPRPRAIAALFEHEDQAPVGVAAVEAEGVDLANGLDSQTAGAALVGERAVEEAIAQHPSPPLERGADRLCNVIRPG